MFWRNISPLAAGLKSKPIKTPAEATASRAGFLLVALFTLEDGANIFSQNIRL
jgi:hypothetical protein